MHRLDTDALWIKGRCSDTTGQANCKTTLRQLGVAGVRPEVWVQDRHVFPTSATEVDTKKAMRAYSNSQETRIAGANIKGKHRGHELLVATQKARERVLCMRV